MIFVTVGTTDFDDLVRAMDALAPTLHEEIVAQIGRGSYEPQNMAFFQFAPSLEPYYQQADLVVAHGGLGTAIEVMERGLRLVGVSNPDRYDRHQEDLLGALAERGHMVWCRDFTDLAQMIQRARASVLVPYESPECHIAEEIRKFLGLASQMNEL